MHPAFISILLDEEIAAVKANDHLAGRMTSINRAGLCVHAHLAPPDRSPLVFCLDGDNYDAAPFGFTVLDSATMQELAPECWPGNLNSGIHPVVQRTFTCLRGTLEYHLHPSHIGDPWERLRHELRLPTLLGHLLNKAYLP